jgi:hypothetical protein
MRQEIKKSLNDQMVSYQAPPNIGTIATATLVKPMARDRCPIESHHTVYLYYRIGSEYRIT